MEVSIRISSTPDMFVWSYGLLELDSGISSTANVMVI
jgi:hypothetical protein